MRGTSPARRFTPTAACSWGSGQGSDAYWFKSIRGTVLRALGRAFARGTQKLTTGSQFKTAHLPDARIATGGPIAPGRLSFGSASNRRASVHNLTRVAADGAAPFAPQARGARRVSSNSVGWRRHARDTCSWRRVGAPAAHAGAVGWWARMGLSAVRTRLQVMKPVLRGQRRPTGNFRHLIQTEGRCDRESDGVRRPG